VAHFNSKISLVTGILLCLTARAVHAQNYNYRMGNTRVVQGAGGLANPSGSYITGGTLSRSAQAGAGVNTYGNLQSGVGTAGITAGATGNNGLQSARMGSTVGMPGDYMRSDLNPNFSYQQPVRQGGRHGQRRGNQQQTSNQPATYGQAYARSTSPATGHAAVMSPASTNQPAQASSSSAAASGTAATAGSGATQATGGEYKGY
jgi:hypothetical protein